MASDSTVARIITLAAFEPSEQVNALFTELVRLALTLTLPWATIEPMIRSIDLQELVRNCAAAEFCLETHWSARIANGEPVESFVYYGAWSKLVTLSLDNYERLCSFELEHIQRCIERPIAGLKVAFAGSGPLPLSARIMARHGANVVCFDIDPKANAAARAWLLLDSLGSSLQFETLDIRTSRSLRDFDLVYIAGLVGTDDVTKRSVLRTVGSQMKLGSLLAARSVQGGRRLLYPHVQISDIEDAGFDVLGHFTPPPDVVNSFVLAVKQ